MKYREYSLTFTLKGVTYIVTLNIVRLPKSQLTNTANVFVNKQIMNNTCTVL